MQRRLKLSKVLTRCLVFILVVGVPLVVSAGPPEEWVARYNSPKTGEDSSRAVTTDASGNVYVTGNSYARCSLTTSKSSSDYATVKYDSNGNQLWVARYNGPGDNDDEARAIAVDASGNVYVTGDSYGEGTYSDYATVKYDSNGNQLWVARYDGPANEFDKARAIVIDASGNVYVTGWSEDSETYDDYTTVKYDSEGNQLWVAQYNGPVNGNDWANAITVDTSGNVYVTGASDGAGRREDYATVKYDSKGNELWVARYSGPGDRHEADDVAWSIAVDALGNVYITGKSDGGETSYDYATVKYDTDGNELWVARYDAWVDRAGAIALDALGNVYVTGDSANLVDETGYDYATVKYDTDGNQLWVKRYNGTENGHDYAYAIAVDASGNIYVTGISARSIGYYRDDADYATVKYDTNGNLLWVKRYNGTGNSDDVARAIAVDVLGNVFVTGSSYGSGMEYDYATVKYDTEGHELWEARYNGPGSGEDDAKAIAVDAAKNVYVTGSSGTVKYDTDGNQLWVSQHPAKAIAVDAAKNVYVTGSSGTVKYDTDGNQLWVSQHPAKAIAVDSWGNVYVTGLSYDSETGYDYATVKYDSNGNELWVQRYNGLGNGWDEANALGIDAWGNVYVTGESRGSETGDDYATVKYDTDGNELWVARYNGPANDSDTANALAVDPSGNVYVTGVSESSKMWFGDTYDTDDYATVKYDTEGNQLWVARYKGPEDYWEDWDDVANAIAVDASGNVYVTGKSYGEETYSDYATVKYDTNGNLLWVARYDGPGNSADEAKAIAVDVSGNVYVTGSGYSRFSPFGWGKEWDGYATVKYDTDGNLLWVARYNGPANEFDCARAMAIDASGNVYVTGESRGIGTGSDYATVKYKYSEATMNLPAGWSMISLPIRPDVATLSTLFPDAVVVYKYQKGTGYVRVRPGENLEVGMGYWILLDNPQSYVIKGTEIAKYDIAVEDGWYMIGGCSMPAQKMVTSGKIDVIYEYTQGVGYTRVPGSEPLERGKGYWILFSSTSEGTEFTASTSLTK